MTQTQGYRETRAAQPNTHAVSNSEFGLTAAELRAQVTIAKDRQPCGDGCGIMTRVRVNGQPGWFTHLANTRRPVPEPEPEVEATPDEVSMFRLLQESITESRKHPIMRIGRDQRESEPWTQITETMRGEHRYRIDIPDGRNAMILDRNGSYPSAMGNVPVAAGQLRRTGGLNLLSTAHAGIYCITRFEWAGPHPLGEIAEQDSETWWISTPHLRLICRLAAHNRITLPRIVDSWTGTAVTNLFKRFSADVSELRERARADRDAYGEVKRKSSIAIRALWPKGSRSPFWRPDWSVSVRAEAAVRHWVRADQAISEGAELVKLGSVDEVAFLTPKRARKGWIPAPYVEGTAFGQVKVKSTVGATEWNRPARGKR